MAPKAPRKMHVDTSTKNPLAPNASNFELDQMNSPDKFTAARARTAFIDQAKAGAQQFGLRLADFDLSEELFSQMRNTDIHVDVEGFYMILCAIKEAHLSAAAVVGEEVTATRSAIEATQ